MALQGTSLHQDEVLTEHMTESTSGHYGTAPGQTLPGYNQRFPLPIMTARFSFAYRPTVQSVPCHNI